MSWTYVQANGNLIHDGELVATGYSGWGDAKNEASAERIPEWGPIPRGKWTIGPRFESETHGPICMRLFPCAGTETFNRSGFLIHGDSIAHPGSASHGCIVIDRAARLRIADCEDREIEVL